MPDAAGILIQLDLLRDGVSRRLILVAAEAGSGIRGQIAAVESGAAPLFTDEDAHRVCRSADSTAGWTTFGSGPNQFNRPGNLFIR